MPTARRTISIDDSSTRFELAESVVIDYPITFVWTVPNGATQVVFDASFVLSKLKISYMKSDRNVTIETNNPSTPEDTIALIANKANHWVDPEAGKPFTTNLDYLMATNSSGAEAKIEFYFGMRN